jgi:hypothetical protein
VVFEAAARLAIEVAAQAFFSKGDRETIELPTISVF